MNTQQHGLKRGRNGAASDAKRTRLSAAATPSSAPLAATSFSGVARTGGRNGVVMRQGGRIYSQAGLMSGTQIPASAPASCSVAHSYTSPRRANQFLTFAEAMAYAASNFPDGCLVEVFPGLDGTTTRSNFEEDFTITSNVTIVAHSTETATLVSAGSWAVWIQGTVTIQPPSETNIDVKMARIGMETLVSTTSEDFSVVPEMLAFEQCEFGTLNIQGPTGVSLTDCFVGFNDGASFTTAFDQGPYVIMQGGLLASEINCTATGLQMLSVQGIDGEIILNGSSYMLATACAFGGFMSPPLDVTVNSYIGATAAFCSCQLSTVTVVGCSLNSNLGALLFNSILNALSLQSRSSPPRATNARAVAHHCFIGNLLVDSLDVVDVADDGSDFYACQFGEIETIGTPRIDLHDSQYDLLGQSISENGTLGRTPIVISTINADDTYLFAPALPDTNFFVTFTQTSGTPSHMPVLASKTTNSIVVTGVPSTTVFSALIQRVPAATSV